MLGGWASLASQLSESENYKCRHIHILILGITALPTKIIVNNLTYHIEHFNPLNSLLKDIVAIMCPKIPEAYYKEVEESFV